MSQRSIVVNNLEWLQFSVTQGLARDLVENSLLATPELAGYRYATMTETVNLLGSYYSGTINESSNSWKTDAAPAAHNFLTDFGITEVIIPNPPALLDLDDGELLPYDMLRLAKFYFGASTLNPPDTMVASVGEAMKGVNWVAGLFTYQRYGMHPAGQQFFSSMLVRESASPATPQGFSIRSR